MVQSLWDAAKAVLRKKFAEIPQEARKILNKQPNFTTKRERRKIRQKQRGVNKT